MFKTKVIILCMLFSCFGFSQTANKTLQSWSKVDLLKHVKTLSSNAFEGRRTGSAGGIKTKKYIINQFYSLKVKPLGASYEQSFTFLKGKTEYKATNILGFIKGTTYPNAYIVISAHYDHEGIKQGNIFNGADDNASGVSALFAFAEYLKQYQPKHSIILAAFDAEELGLKGSEAFINQTNIPLKKIKLNLNMDMISRSDKNELYIAGTAYNTNLKATISKLPTRPGFTLKLGHDGADQLDDWTFASDHANFHKKNIPFLYFGVEDHKDYHEPTDDYENIHPEFYKKAVRNIISVFKAIDQSNI